MSTRQPHESGEPPYQDCDGGGKKLVRRVLPRLPQVQTELETFERRLALSANAAASLLIDALDPTIDSVESDQGCHPLAPAPIEVTTSANDTGGAGSTSGLLQQATAVRERWNLDGTGQTVAVIDSGIAWDHVALGSGFGPGYRVVGGWDFAENDDNPYDDAPGGFHGTHVSGLIAGESDRLTGVAPGADLVGLRVFTDTGQSSLDWIESALQWVYDNRNSFEHPITTVNLSVGASLVGAMINDIEAKFANELTQLYEANIVVVAAAGNQFNALQPDHLNYPASSDLVWGVASTDATGTLSQFSQREDQILATVGRNVTSSIPDHVLGWDGNVADYYPATGTSMAAPQIAGAAVLLREAIESSGGAATPDGLLEILRSTAHSRVDSETGLTYYDIDLNAAIASVMGDGNGGDGEGNDGAVPDATTDLGRLDWGQTTLTNDSAVKVTVMRDGVFSLNVDAGAEHQTLRITNTAGQVVWDGVFGSSRQIDIEAEADQVLTIHAPNATQPFAIRFANVVDVNGSSLQLASSTADPRIAIDLNNGVNLSVGEFQYHFSSGSITSGVIDGGNGADHLDLRGSTASGRLTLNPYQDGSWREAGIDFVLRGFEEVAYVGGGGADRVYLYDTTGDDRLEARPGNAALQGVGFRYDVEQVERTYVYATAGGNDVAFLYDSDGDEHLAVRPQFVSLRGGQFFNIANGFERVYAYATNGKDTAELYDSSGSDRMSASASSALIAGPGYYVQAKQFDYVAAYATAGGTDLATLYSNGDQDDRWTRTENQLTLKAADNSERVAHGFEVTRAIVQGNEVNVQPLGALLSDSATNSNAWVKLEATEHDTDETAAALAQWMAIDETKQRQAIDALFRHEDEAAS